MTDSKIAVLKRLCDDYGLDRNSDFFTSKQGFTIIVRSGIEKIQYQLGMQVNFDVIKCEDNFACVKAIGTKAGKTPIQTFGSAKWGAYVDIVKKAKGGREYTSKELQGSTNSYYVMEIAEKRALARVVLKMADLYQYNVFSEDENPDEMTKKTEEVQNKADAALDAALAKNR